MRFEHVSDLLCLVVQLKEEVERLRSIRTPVKDIDWWSHSLPALRKMNQPNVPQDVEDPLPSLQQAGGDLGDGGNGGRSLLAVAGKSLPGLPPLPVFPYRVGRRLWKLKARKTII